MAFSKNFFLVLFLHPYLASSWFSSDGWYLFSSVCMCVCQSVIRITPLQNKKKPPIMKPKHRQISTLSLQKTRKVGGRWGRKPGSLGTTQQHQNLHFSKTEKKNKNKKGLHQHQHHLDGSCSLGGAFWICR